MFTFKCFRHGRVGYLNHALWLLNCYPTWFQELMKISLILFEFIHKALLCNISASATTSMNWFSFFTERERLLLLILFSHLWKLLAFLSIDSIIFSWRINMILNWLFQRRVFLYLACLIFKSFHSPLISFGLYKITV